MDCSVTMGWCFEDEGDDSSEAILDVLGPWEAVVPSIWSFEVANTLLVGERRKRISKLDSSNFLSFLAVLPVTIDDSSTGRALGPILALAREYGLSAYDAAYLELAMRESLPLATRDRVLERAAVSLGVSVVSR
ncbi:MAG: type II toxin-antitoxin system VapC family toxin [Terriglobia bacterium]